MNISSGKNLLTNLMSNGGFCYKFQMNILRRHGGALHAYLG